MAAGGGWRGEEQRFGSFDPRIGSDEDCATKRQREVSREPEQKKVDNQIGRVRSGTPKRISHTSSKQTVNKWLSCVRRRERAEATSHRIGEQTGFQNNKMRIFMIKKWIFASQKGRHSYLRQEDQKFAVWWERTVRGWGRSPKNWKLDYGEYF